MDMNHEVDISALHSYPLLGKGEALAVPSDAPAREIDSPESTSGTREAVSVIGDEEIAATGSVPKLSLGVTNVGPKCAACDVSGGVCLHHVLPESVQLTLATDGEGGTYFVTSNAREAHVQITHGDILAVFKPCAEEIGSAQNPRGNDEGCRVDGFTPGSGAAREVAAYSLDHLHRANVPETVLKTIPTKGVGSLQRYVTNLYQSWNMSSETRHKIRIGDLQYLGLFDIRVLNTDRHGGNILVNQNTGQLYAIDHSYILPPRFVDPEWDWASWPESKKLIDEHVRKFFIALDDEADVETLRKLGIDEVSCTMFRASSTALRMLLQTGKPLSLRRVSEFFRRTSLAFPSPFEECVTESRGPLNEGAVINLTRLASLLQSRATEFVNS